MRIRSFKGLFPSPKLAADVAAVPYDVVNREEAFDLAHDKPLNLLHVDRAEIDLPLDVDPYDAQVYAKALENFTTLQDEKVLLRESRPCMYLYRQSVGKHSQTGLVTTCHVQDYEKDVIKKHEKTRQDKEDDRTRLVDTLSANTGPIFLTYRGNKSIDAVIKGAMEAAPINDFTAADGVRHQVWRVGAGACVSLESLFADKVPCAYIADGHHRAASAFRVGKMRQERAKGASTGEEDFNWFLGVLFPADELFILPYNRAVKDLNGLTVEEFVAKVESIFSLKYTTAKDPAEPGQCCMYLDGKWHALSWKPDANASPIDQLDVSILQDRLLKPVLGIDDPRTSKRIDFIGGIRGTPELERLVNNGDAAVAFSMYPVTVDQLMAISDAGQIMPPKSTWFEPKLRSGLFIHTF